MKIFRKLNDEVYEKFLLFFLTMRIEVEYRIKYVCELQSQD